MDARNPRPRVLLITGGLLNSQEGSLGEVLRKTVPQMLHSRHGWLDLKIKAVAAETLLAWKKALDSKSGEWVRLRTWLDGFGSMDVDAPNLTETLLAGLLEARGVDVDCLGIGDLFTRRSRSRKVLSRVDCVWISSTYLHDLSELEAVVERVRRPGLKIVLGGALVGALKAGYQGHPDVDVMVAGYGERVVEVLVDWMGGGFRGLAPPPGGRLETRGSSQFLFAGLPPGLSLDDLPRPDWAAAFRRRGRSFGRIGYESVRGCPYRCAFCNYPYLFDDNRFRTRSAKTIAADWEHYSRDLGVRRIECLDSLFTMPPRRLEELCALLVERKLDLKWSCYARADDLCDENRVRAMVAAGASHVQIGMESGDQGQLDRMNKRCAVEKIQTALVNCRKHGLATIVSLIVGYPGETTETLERTYQVLTETPPDFHFLATFSVRVPGVPVLEPGYAGAMGLRTFANRWAMAPYWRHDTMGCDQVGNQVRTLSRRLLENSISLDAAMFHRWTDGYHPSMREEWLELQRRVLPHLQRRLKWFDWLHRWIDGNLSRDLEGVLPSSVIESGTNEP